jgi:hypothetical protein
VLPAEVILFNFRWAILRGEAAKLETLVRFVRYSALAAHSSKLTANSLNNVYN